jgi:hypothetical protein
VRLQHHGEPAEGFAIGYYLCHDPREPGSERRNVLFCPLADIEYFPCARASAYAASPEPVHSAYFVDEFGHFVRGHVRCVVGSCATHLCKVLAAVAIFIIFCFVESFEMVCRFFFLPVSIVAWC